jgi:predicted nuclease with RNAse H fold
MNAINSLFLGWDVGAWNCDKNARSRDALCALKATSNGLAVVGIPFWGNLRETLVRYEGQRLIDEMLRLVKAQSVGPSRVTIAIDAPLAWPTEMLGLLNDGALFDVPREARENPYLYRIQERRPFVGKHYALSPVKDMIGSQSTKAIYFLRRAGLPPTSVGIWGSESVTAIEAYPAPIKKGIKHIKREAERLLKQYSAPARPMGKARKNDVTDAILCALVGWFHRMDRAQLEAPTSDADRAEGWIWVPKATATIRLR